MLYPNNSIVNIEDIGYGANALYCITDRVNCCRQSDGGASGEWYKPGETTPVDGNGLTSTQTLSKSRNSSVVALHRRKDNIPTGLYRCELLNSGGENQSIYIGLYEAGMEGKYVTVHL